VNWDRAVHHVEAAAGECQRVHELPPVMVPLRVTQMWVFGDVLGPKRDLETVSLALSLDLPAEDVAWLTNPPAAMHWLGMTRLPKNPVRVWWRSARAPVWNHRIVQPLLVWSSADGVLEDAMNALREGRGKALGLAKPSADELATRLSQELAISLSTLRKRTADYEDKRWGRAKLEPTADALWLAADGYLDLLDAQS
jgi:hypothetical protein